MKRTRLKPVNRKRRQSEFQRAFHSPARVKYVRALGCLVCYHVPAENHHIENGGAGRKADYDKIANLCHSHHSELHCVGRKDFERRYGVDLEAAARAVAAAWEAR